MINTYKNFLSFLMVIKVVQPQVTMMESGEKCFSSHNCHPFGKKLIHSHILCNSFSNCDFLYQCFVENTSHVIIHDDCSPAKWVTQLTCFDKGSGRKCNCELSCKNEFYCEDYHCPDAECICKTKILTSVWLINSEFMVGNGSYDWLATIDQSLISCIGQELIGMDPRISYEIRGVEDYLMISGVSSITINGTAVKICSRSRCNNVVCATQDRFLLWWGLSAICTLAIICGLLYLIYSKITQNRLKTSQRANLSVKYTKGTKTNKKSIEAIEYQPELISSERKSPSMSRSQSLEECSLAIKAEKRVINPSPRSLFFSQVTLLSMVLLLCTSNACVVTNSLRHSQESCTDLKCKSELDYEMEGVLENTNLCFYSEHAGHKSNFQYSLLSYSLHCSGQVLYATGDYIPKVYDRSFCDGRNACYFWGSCESMSDARLFQAYKSEGMSKHMSVNGERWCHNFGATFGCMAAMLGANACVHLAVNYTLSGHVQVLECSEWYPKIVVRYMDHSRTEDCEIRPSTKQKCGNYSILVEAQPIPQLGNMKFLSSKNLLWLGPVSEKYSPQGHLPGAVQFTQEGIFTPGRSGIKCDYESWVPSCLFEFTQTYKFLNSHGDSSFFHSGFKFTKVRKTDIIASYVNSHFRLVITVDDDVHHVEPIAGKCALINPIITGCADCQKENILTITVLTKTVDAIATISCVDPFINVRVRAYKAITIPFDSSNANIAMKCAYTCGSTRASFVVNATLSKEEVDFNLDVEGQEETEGTMEEGWLPTTWLGWLLTSFWLILALGLIGLGIGCFVFRTVATEVWKTLCCCRKAIRQVQDAQEMQPMNHN